MLASTMVDTASLRAFSKQKLLQDFSALVENDQQQTAHMLAYIGEIDRRKLYLEQAYPSMFAFCTGRFRMSEATAAKRIRAGRAACRFPCILDMIAKGELHVSGVHQLATHLTEDNHRNVLRLAKHRTMREIEKLIAEIAPKPDVKASLRALPMDRTTRTAARGASARDDPPSATGAPPEAVCSDRTTPDASTPASASEEKKAPTPLRRQAERPANKPRGTTTPLAPRRYKLQVTIGQEARDKLEELQGLLSHQIPDGDPATIVERALDVLLAEAKKQRAALTDSPRTSSRASTTRAIPAHVRREVFKRDKGRCAYRNRDGRRCDSAWNVEFHHKVPYAKGGNHSASNIELRCWGHNQYEAELEFGEQFMSRQRSARKRV